MSTKTDKPKVVITMISPRWNYFQHFLLGFHELEAKGLIRLRMKAGLGFKLSTLLGNGFIARLFRAGYYRILLKKFPWLVRDSYNMEGYVEYRGKKKRFCLDSADAPYLFDCDTLDRVDAYFKMQCPKEIEPDKGFELASGIYAPYCDHKHADKSVKRLTQASPRAACRNLATHLGKVHPLLIGFRNLSRSNSYKGLRAGYDNYLKGGGKNATKIAMCYFGNSQGPEPTKMVSGQLPDWDWERDIMGYFGSKVSHPNEKRSIISKILNKKGGLFDGRVIHDGYSDTKAKRHDELIVPIEQFCDHISQFQYNINVSGYRMSIPNRFMESFIVGTAILTDKLNVKWYKPFDDGEVIETVEMGYLPMDKVDWEQFNRDLDALPKVDKQTVLAAFHRKWAPEPVAKYIINTTLGEEILL